MQPTPKTCSCQGGWKCPACADALDSRIAELNALLDDAEELDVYIIPMLDDNEEEVDCRYVLADELQAILAKREQPKRNPTEPRSRPIQGGWLEKDTLTGEVHEPVIQRKPERT